MVDLSKHILSVKQALDRRGYDLALEKCYEMLDVEPGNIEVHRLLLDAARRKAKEAGKKSLFGGLMGGLSGSMSKDPHKQLIAAAKALGGAPEPKSLLQMADVAMRLAPTAKPMREIALFYFEEHHKTGMFNDKALWANAQAMYEKHKETDDDAQLETALNLMRELEKAKPDHTDAGKTVKNWEAYKSMRFRQKQSQGKASDYTAQVNDTSMARRQEVMNRMIRTTADADEVVRFLDEDLKTNPDDKALWIKRGDTQARVGRTAEARENFQRAAQIDPNDFVVIMKLGDIRIADAEVKLRAAPEDQAAKQALIQVRMEEYRLRVERQPTDMSHRYSLGNTLLSLGQIEAAASEFQRTVADPRYRQASHKFLGYCFGKKNLLDLAAQHYNASLALCVDELGDEAKQIRFALARVFEESGKKDQAIIQFEKLVSIDLGYKDAADRLNKLRGI